MDWNEELALKTWWQLDGHAPGGHSRSAGGQPGGRAAAVRPGETLELDGESFRVTATLAQTGTQEDDLIYLDLATAQRLWDRSDELSLIEVSAWCSTCPIEDINAQIAMALPGARVSALLKAVESRSLLIDQFRLFSAVLSALMILVGCLIVLVLDAGGVRDRRGEIGIFRAIGYRRKHIFTVILLENLALALLGASVGLALCRAGGRDPLAQAVAGVREALRPRARPPWPWPWVRRWEWCSWPASIRPGRRPG